LSDDDVTRLLETLKTATSPEGQRDYALFHLMIASGIRLGSAIALDVEDVDLDLGELWLRSTKGNRPERVFLGKAIREHLRPFIGRRMSGPLFLARSGEHISLRHVQRRFQEWLEKAGIAASASIHTLRHTFASRLLGRTHDIFLVKEALRHRSITSTIVYARPDEERLRQVMQG
jgi:site-specific recombinase XerC